MDPSRYQQIKSLFNEGLDLALPERASWLAALRDREPDLAAEVIKLLEAHEDAETFLAEPVDAGQIAMALDEQVTVTEMPTFGDRFRILELLGQGGMGSVFLAWQTRPVERKVAIKTVKAGKVPEVLLNRFELERNVLARLSHPNISKIYEAGITAAGTPYFVMEYIEGEPITHYCDRQCLTVAERMWLLVQVCRAVHHAHQMGVIHRDLKPANVMIAVEGGRPVPKIIDFGIVKSTEPAGDDARLTGIQVKVGTPAYMSPEQWRSLDVDTRADVYALGVMLYELMTGSRPFGGRNPLEIMHQVKVGTYPPPVEMIDQGKEPIEELARCRGTEPNRLRRQLAREPSWIAAKALASERQQRYASVADLADDLARHLAGEAVLAGPDHWRYRWRKALRRNAVSLASVGFVALALLLGLVVTLRSLSQAVTARDQAATARVEAAAEAATAEAVKRFLLEMLKSADPSNNGYQVTVLEILNQVSTSIDQHFPEQPRLQGELMRVLGTIYMDLGEDARAERLLLQAQETLRDQLGSEHEARTVALAELVSFYLDREREVEVGPWLNALAEQPVRFPSDTWCRRLLTLRAEALSDGPQAVLMPLVDLRRAAAAELGAEAPLILEMDLRRAQLLLKTGQTEAACALFGDVAAKAEHLWDTGHPLIRLANRGKQACSPDAATSAPKADIRE
jgi:serine/threonine protein kinase